MSLADLPTKAEMEAAWAGKPQLKGVTRTQANHAADQDDKKQLAAWKTAVWQRDKGVCRSCGRTVVKCLDHVPQRGEVHHIVGRADRAVRYDRRNGVLVCGDCHDKLTGAVDMARLHVVGTAAQRYEVNGKPYPNGDKKLRFL